MKKLSFMLFRSDNYDELINLWQKAELPYKPKGRDSFSNISNQIKQKNCEIIFAKLSKKIIGSILVSHDGRKGWINRLAVLPEFRRHGLAQKLIKEAENWLEQAGIKIFACLIEGGNKNSMRLIEKAGYKNFAGMQYYTKRKFPEI
ncbi:MAG: GNAT family N-acetyltransferase [Candidatus Cloacimonetes bacterium]|nr:GNAT family N-acetyltransferase [Candidatus Cloacimonadota bacterium]MBS3766547.1 GNAT family N-acetyltransferase [Candidatus Cloacimonadota bacterium]